MIFHGHHEWSAVGFDTVRCIWCGCAESSPWIRVALSANTCPGVPPGTTLQHLLQAARAVVALDRWWLDEHGETTLAELERALEPFTAPGTGAPVPAHPPDEPGPEVGT